MALIMLVEHNLFSILFELKAKFSDMGVWEKRLEIVAQYFSDLIQVLQCSQWSLC